MTNITINITTLNLTAGEAARFPSLPMVIGALIHRAMEEAGNPETGEVKPGDVGTASAPVESERAVLTRDNVLSFLNSDPRYTKRTFEAISKHFDTDDNVDLTELLDEMVDNGDLSTKTRRSDGATLYEAATSAPVASETTTEATTPASEVGIRTFLGSDPRYTKRTLEAIQKHFASTHAEEVENLVNEMVVNGDIKTSTRRSDCNYLYELA